MPPSRAIATASRVSVTVSIAALTMGRLMLMCRVRSVRTSVSRGVTDDSAGINRTSSKVKASPVHLSSQFTVSSFASGTCCGSVAVGVPLAHLLKMQLFYYLTA